MSDMIDRTEFEEQLGALRRRVHKNQDLLRHVEGLVWELQARVSAIDAVADDVLARPTPAVADDDVDLVRDHKWVVGDRALVVMAMFYGEDTGRILSAHLTAAGAADQLASNLAARDPRNCDLPPLFVTSGTVKRVDVLANTVLEISPCVIV